jgi:hypothetical protein
VDDPKALSLGVFQNNAVGFSRKQLKNSTSWYMALASAEPALWRYIFQQAAAHVYTDQGDVIYGGSGVLAIHTDAGGDRRITLKNGVQKNIILEPYSTTLLDSETGENLLPGEREHR